MAGAAPYSAWRQQANTYYVSGQLPIDPKTGKFPSGIAAQTQTALENLERVTAEFNCSRQDVVKTTVFLRNFDDFASMNEVYARFFADPYPARSAFAVADLMPGADIEIEAIVAKQ
ncbi:reactive intermediate/imine deaminase [Bombiscardovia nodaiensis]|uniref:Reactive intermediate/imine deaminase n=1 Tax=Bombiscardovia nodaiensis TaxID=2932181 RepID=A0ABM8B8X2_9BIFI|nr:reactive intermediate/imine deaminase [Bombiscardovia nodaiensis]